MKFQGITIIFLIIITITACSHTAKADSLLSDGEGYSDLYSTNRACKVGDVVTVIFDESTVSSQKATGKLKNEYLNEMNPGKGLLNFFLGLTLGGSQTQNVESSTTQGNTLNAKMSAQIVEILPHGQAKIVGMKSLEINHEVQKLSVEGVVRIRDITPDNTINSSKIGNMQSKVNGLPVNRSIKNDKGGVINWIWKLLF
jgi:flagellar L-ring protein FlgH